MSRIGVVAGSTGLVGQQRQGAQSEQPGQQSRAHESDEIAAPGESALRL